MIHLGEARRMFSPELCMGRLFFERFGGGLEVWNSLKGSLLRLKSFRLE